jgi:DMSO/TMAO reductase YedYZ molybdopterin-dependent catalytic subunit
MDEPVLLKVDGEVERPLALRFEDLDALPEVFHVRDVSRFHPKRQGDGVALEAILQHARPRPDANYLTLHADRDDFHVSVPLQAVREEAVVVFKHGDKRLGLEHGGPVRLLIKDPSACHTSELDDCANVKFLSRIELSVRRGRDTRPVDEASHSALHQAQDEGHGAR